MCRRRFLAVRSALCVHSGDGAITRVSHALPVHVLCGAVCSFRVVRSWCVRVSHCLRICWRCQCGHRAAAAAAAASRVWCHPGCRQPLLLVAAAAAAAPRRALARPCMVVSLAAGICTGEFSASCCGHAASTAKHLRGPLLVRPPQQAGCRLARGSVPPVYSPYHCFTACERVHSPGCWLAGCVTAAALASAACAHCACDGRHSRAVGVTAGSSQLAFLSGALHARLTAPEEAGSVQSSPMRAWRPPAACSPVV